MECRVRGMAGLALQWCVGPLCKCVGAHRGTLSSLVCLLGCKVCGVLCDLHMRCRRVVRPSAPTGLQYTCAFTCE